MLQSFASLSRQFSPAYWVQQSLKIILSLVLWFAISGTPLAFAADTSNPVGDLLRQPAAEISISLGSATSELKFFPNLLEFESGKRYKLVLKNPSAQKHYFTSKDFADASWTQKVEAGNVEIKGAIRELELKPGAEAEWVFVPLKSGSYNLQCTIPGHREAGMTGKIVISAAVGA